MRSKWSSRNSWYTSQTCLVQTENGIGTILDYDDFNIQHTLEAQAAIFDALNQVVDHSNVHSDYSKAVKWCRDAHMNQWAYFPGEEEPTKIVQGLFSGNRGTNFLNTILNLAYFLLAKKQVAEHLDVEPIRLYHIHHGDDVWLYNECPLWPALIYIVMLVMGFKFAAAKQLFDRLRSEFLRVLYTKEGAFGFLARAVPSLFLNPIQGVELISPADAASAATAQLNILARRGMTAECVQLLWNAIVPYQATSNVGEAGISIPLGVMMKRYIDGGLDLGYPRTMASAATRTAPIPVMQGGSKALEEAVESNMSQDWANHMSKALQEPFNIDSVVDALHSLNVCDSLRNEDRLRNQLVHEEDLTKWSSSLIDIKGKRTAGNYMRIFSENTTE